MLVEVGRWQGRGAPQKWKIGGEDQARSYVFILCLSPRELETRVRRKELGPRKWRGQAAFATPGKEQRSFREHRCDLGGRGQVGTRSSQGEGQKR